MPPSGTSPDMRTRRIIAIVVAFAALPLVVLGLIDPIEGGIALLAAIGLGVVAWVLSRVPVPKLAWIAAAATLVVGAVTIAMAVANIPAGPQPGPDTVMEPMRGALVALNWVWRAGVLVTLAGAVLYIARLFQSLRSAEAGR